jgi:hypothetical protein
MDGVSGGDRCHIGRLGFTVLPEVVVENGVGFSHGTTVLYSIKSWC